MMAMTTSNSTRVNPRCPRRMADLPPPADDNPASKCGVQPSVDTVALEPAFAASRSRQWNDCQEPFHDVSRAAIVTSTLLAKTVEAGIAKSGNRISGSQPVLRLRLAWPGLYRCLGRSKR